MSLLPYALLRPFLFRLDAEAAHELTLAQLERIQHTPLLALAAQPRIDDPLTLAGLRFPNRVGLAAGLDKNARCIDAWGALGFGFVEVGTVTPLAQAGNPKPRIFRLPQSRALINRLGFNNEGLAAFVANVRRSRLRAQRPTTPDSAAPALVLGLNIGKNAATPIERASDDYLAALEAVYPHADYVAVNISSPNTQNLRALQSDAALEQLLAALAERRAELSAASGVYRPLFIKIAPDLEAEQIEAIAAALLRHGMDGVIATNTTLAAAPCKASHTPTRPAGYRARRCCKPATPWCARCASAWGQISRSSAWAACKAGPTRRASSKPGPTWCNSTPA